MYHISKDKRAVKSAKLIGEGMVRLLRRTSFEKISISALNQETGISRATFYRLFDRVEDVLEYLCDSIFDEIGVEMRGREFESTKEFLLSFIDKWIAHDSLLECLSKNGLMGILCSSHLKKQELVYAMLRLRAPVDEERMDYICYLLAYLMPMAFDVWVLHGKKENAEGLYNNLVRAYRTVGKMF